MLARGGNFQLCDRGGLCVLFPERVISNRVLVRKALDQRRR